MTDFDELDNLLSESTALIKEAKAVKEGKKALRTSSSLMNASERAYIEAKVAEWDAKHTWQTIELVAVFRRQQCACGAVHKTFSHFMHHQKHRTDTFAQRWVSAAYGPKASDDTNLPRTVAYTDSITPLCEICAEHDGFDVDAEGCQSWAVGVNGENFDV